MTDFKHRQKIAELSLEDFDSIELVKTNRDNITFESAQKDLAKKYPKAAFILIVGSDMLEFVPSWQGFEDWMKQNELAVVLRDNKHEQATQKLLQKLKLKATILPAVWSPVSSTIVKTDIARNGRSDLVHCQAMDYIQKHKLY